MSERKLPTTQHVILGTLVVLVACMCIRILESDAAAQPITTTPDLPPAPEYVELRVRDFACGQPRSDWRLAQVRLDQVAAAIRMDDGHTYLRGPNVQAEVPYEKWCAAIRATTRSRGSGG